MQDKEREYKRIFFIGLILISLGITFSTTLEDKVGSLGVVFVSIGGFLFIVAMSKKKKLKEGKNKDRE